jgi:hypothetical protein
MSRMSRAVLRISLQPQPREVTIRQGRQRQEDDVFRKNLALLSLTLKRMRMSTGENGGRA